MSYYRTHRAKKKPKSNEEVKLYKLLPKHQKTKTKIKEEKRCSLNDLFVVKDTSTGNNTKVMSSNKRSRNRTAKKFDV